MCESDCRSSSFFRCTETPFFSPTEVHGAIEYDRVTVDLLGWAVVICDHDTYNVLYEYSTYKKNNTPRLQGYSKVLEAKWALAGAACRERKQPRYRLNRHGLLLPSTTLMGRLGDILYDRSDKASGFVQVHGRRKLTTKQDCHLLHLVSQSPIFHVPWQTPWQGAALKQSYSTSKNGHFSE